MRLDATRQWKQMNSQQITTKNFFFEIESKNKQRQWHSSHISFKLNDKLLWHQNLNIFFDKKCQADRNVLNVTAYFPSDAEPGGNCVFTVDTKNLQRTWFIYLCILLHTYTLLIYSPK